MKRTLHWFGQSAPLSVLRRGRSRTEHAKLSDSLHMLRDDGVAFHLMALAHRLFECEHGSLLLNLPKAVFFATNPQDNPAPPALGPKDIIVVSTRPALDDDSAGRRSLSKSGTKLEQLIHRAFHEVIQRCCRQYLFLRGDLSFEDQEQRNYRSVLFGQQNGAFIRANGDLEDVVDLEAIDKGERASTVGYFVSIPDAWPNGPSLLACFGMDGTNSLLWSYLLQTPRMFPLIKRVVELNRPSVIAGEFEPLVPEDHRPADLSFAKDWKINIRVIATRD